MVELVRHFINKGRYTATGLLFAVAIVLSGVGSWALSATASAAACDKVNIVYCGLQGSGMNAILSSFQSKYEQGSDHGHSDLKTVYNWSGADAAAVHDSASQWQMGTMYRNGDIKVGGDTVGKDAWVAARFTQGNGFVKISDGVWARKTTTSLAEASTPVLVHMSKDGSATFAVMKTCGNAVKFTPVAKPKVKNTPAKVTKSLVCSALTMQQGSTAGTYTFSAQATTQNTAISSYVFTYTDTTDNTSTTSTVNSTATTASDTHTFAVNGHSYRASVAVNGNVTSSACAVTINTTAPTTPVTPTPTQPAQSLPKTGSDAAAMGSIFGASVVAGTLGYRFFQRRKFNA